MLLKSGFIFWRTKKCKAKLRARFKYRTSIHTCMAHRVSIRSFFFRSRSVYFRISYVLYLLLFSLCVCVCVCLFNFVYVWNVSLVWNVFSCTCWCLLLKFQIVLWCSRTFFLRPVSLSLVILFFVPFSLIFHWHPPQSFILLSIIPFLLLFYSSFFSGQTCLHSKYSYTWMCIIHSCMSVFACVCVSLDKHIKMRGQIHTRIHMHNHIWTYV